MAVCRMDLESVVGHLEARYLNERDGNTTWVMV
jgi:hypothetical protein